MRKLLAVMLLTSMTLGACSGQANSESEASASATANETDGGIGSDAPLESDQEPIADGTNDETDSDGRSTDSSFEDVEATTKYNNILRMRQYWIDDVEVGSSTYHDYTGITYYDIADANGDQIVPVFEEKPLEDEHPDINGVPVPVWAPMLSSAFAEDLDKALSQYADYRPTIIQGVLKGYYNEGIILNDIWIEGDIKGDFNVGDIITVGCNKVMLSYVGGALGTVVFGSQCE